MAGPVSGALIPSSRMVVILLITLLTGGELSDESILSLMAKC